MSVCEWNLVPGSQFVLWEVTCPGPSWDLINVQATILGRKFILMLPQACRSKKITKPAGPNFSVLLPPR